MKRLGMITLCVTLFVAACQPAAEVTPDLPTLAALPTSTSTETATLEPTATLTSTATETPPEEPTLEPSFTPSITPTITPTAELTATPSVTPFISSTPNATAVVIRTATARALERPIFSTLTPLPAGSNPVVVRPTSTGTPEIIADVIITEGQMQEEINRLRTRYPEIQRVSIDFVPAGIDVTMTSAANAFETGVVRVTFKLVGSEQSINRFLEIGVVSPEEFRMSGGGAPSDAFVDLAYDKMFLLVGEAFGFILDQRLGKGRHDLEFLTIIDERMAIKLYVPDPGRP